MSNWDLLTESYHETSLGPSLGVGFLTGVGFFLDLLSTANPWWKAAIALALGTVVFGAQILWRFFRAFLRNESVRRRESANGYLLVALKRCFDGVHAAYRNDGQVDSNEFREILQQFCEALHKFYAYKTTATIGVSIKIFDSDPELVRTVARNEKAEKRYQQSFNDFEHRVADSTAFNHVMAGLRTSQEASMDKICYVNRDIESDYRANKYVSSSIDYLHDTQGQEGSYPLKYQSELVVPIIPPLGIRGELTEEGTAAGFLCIDVDEKNTKAFDLAYEFQTLLGVGHGIFLLSQMLNQPPNEHLP